MTATLLNSAAIRRLLPVGRWLIPLLVSLFSGCGILTQDLAEPNLSWNMHRDPERITQWTLAQTDLEGIGNGCDALVWLAEMCPSKCAGASAGYVKVYRKIETGWPTGTVDKRYLLIIRDEWGQLVKSTAPASVMETYKQLTPPDDIPPDYQKARSQSLFKRNN